MKDEITDTGEDSEFEEKIRFERQMEKDASWRDEGWKIHTFKGTDEAVYDTPANRRPRKHPLLSKTVEANPMDPVNIVNQINRQRRNWSPLVTFRLVEVMGNKRTFHVFLDGGRLRYVMRTNWGNRGYEVSPGEVEEALPKNVDRFSSVKAVANYITTLLKRYYKVVKVEQLEELEGLNA